MKKSELTKSRIYQYINSNPWQSSIQISKFLWITRVAVLHYLQELLKNNKIYKTGNTRATRYFVLVEKYPMKISRDFFTSLKKDLMNEYDWLEDIYIPNLLDSLLAILKADWTWEYGFQAFIEKIIKENSWKIPSEKLLYKRVFSFLISFFEEERKRRKNWFFDGTESLRIIMNSYDTKSYIDKLLFTQISTLPHFWRLRGTTELFYWKLDQNKYLIEKSITRSISLIIDFIRKSKIKHVIFTPPTLKRKTQFRDILKEILNKNDIYLKEISCEKIKSDFIHTLRPQKELKWYDRIINATKTIVLKNTWINTDSIVIFDDNFTTWATLNSIAEKLRNSNYIWNITAITITWNFEYIPWVTDVWEI